MKIKSICLLTASAIVSSCLLFLLRAQTQEAAIPTAVDSSGKYTAKSPDWSKIAWANFPSVSQSGYFTIPQELMNKIGYNPSRSWNAGQKPDSIIMLGDVEDTFKLGSLTLKSISAIVPADPKMTLNDLELIKWQTPASLVKAIPELAHLDVSQVKPIQDLFAQSGISNSGAIAQVLESNPQAASLPLGKLDLSQYLIDSIPQLSETEISKFKNWQQSFINQVPGLNQIPLNKLPQPINAGTDVVGVASVVLGQAEHGDPKANTSYYISGSVDLTNKTVPVACQAGTYCPYMELGDVAGIDGALYGKRWVSGSSQKVKGGFGILGSVNGGLEPTGRLVYGNGFKVVLTGVNESTGTAEFSLFFRICASSPVVSKTCTPYFIGPVPWLPVKENDLVIVGTG